MKNKDLILSVSDLTKILNSIFYTKNSLLNLSQEDKKEFEQLEKKIQFLFNCALNLPENKLLESEENNNISILDEDNSLFEDEEILFENEICHIPTKFLYNDSSTERVKVNITILITHVGFKCVIDDGEENPFEVIIEEIYLSEDDENEKYLTCRNHEGEFNIFVSDSFFEDLKNSLE
jgi:hypothetical protein